MERVKVDRELVLSLFPELADALPAAMKHAENEVARALKSWMERERIRLCGFHKDPDDFTAEETYRIEALSYIAASLEE